MTSTLGTLEQAQRPLRTDHDAVSATAHGPTNKVSPGDLLLVLDVLSAGAENTVLCDVIRMRKGPRNTFNVKSVPTRSTYLAGPCFAALSCASLALSRSMRDSSADSVKGYGGFLFLLPGFFFAAHAFARRAGGIAAVHPRYRSRPQLLLSAG